MQVFFKVFYTNTSIVSRKKLTNNLRLAAVVPASNHPFYRRRAAWRRTALIRLPRLVRSQCLLLCLIQGTYPFKFDRGWTYPPAPKSVYGETRYHIASGAQSSRSNRVRLTK